MNSNAELQIQIESDGRIFSSVIFLIVDEPIGGTMQDQQREPLSGETRVK
jgi:hypothetical protein